MGIAVIYEPKKQRYWIYAGDQAMEVIYKSRHIHSVPELNLETDSWIPNADVVLGGSHQMPSTAHRPHWLFQDHR